MYELKPYKPYAPLQETEKKKYTSKTIIAQAYHWRCCFRRSSSVPGSLETFQPFYPSTKGKWVSSFLKTMSSEIGFPMTLASGAFVNKKRNKRTMNYKTILIAAVFHFVYQVEKDSLKHHKMTQNSVSFSYQ